MYYRLYKESDQMVNVCRGNNVNEWKDNINNIATKIKKFISLLGAEMQKDIQRFVYQVTTANASPESSVEKDLYQTWNCNMTPLFEDQTNTAPLRKQFVRITPGWRE